MATVKKSKTKIIVPICIVLVIAIAAGAIFGVSKSNSGEEVSLYTISTEDIYESVSLTGDVSAGTVKEYKVATVATVKEVFVNVGDKVKKGDVLATFNAESLDGQISELSSSYNSALKGYNEAVKTQKTAKAKADALAAQIAATEKQIAKLTANALTTTTTKKKQTTTTTTQKATAPSVTQPSTTTTTTTASPTTTVAYPTSAIAMLVADTPTLPSMPDLSALSDALAELNKNLVQLTDDLNTLATMTEIISVTITEAIASGMFDSEVIADRVADAVYQAMRDGIIDSANLLVENDVAVNMIRTAVASIDFSAITSTVVNSNNVSLTAAQLQLAALQAQYTIYSVQADETIVNAQKTAVDASKKALDALRQQKKDMEEGWIAAFDGTITAVDIAAGVQTTALSTGIKLENLDSMAVTVSLSEYDLHKVRVGMPAKIKTAYGSYDGEVATIAPTATGGSSSSILDSVGSMAGISGLSSLTDTGAGVDCTVTVPETDENIIVGFDAQVEIETGEYLGVVVVPIESIKLEKTGSYVYLYNEEENTVTKTQIETGAVSNTAYQVKSGLKAGDKIVAAPAADYEEDTFSVKVVTK
ncbi:MAG: biotin/lipoyl-binding protein [Eubacterium sp.]|nr:biotin/lipoyl-binding protein [Eubacterium sp.]